MAGKCTPPHNYASFSSQNLERLPLSHSLIMMFWCLNLHWCVSFLQHGCYVTLADILKKVMP